MIGQRYSTKKTAVLDVFRRYQSNRGGDEDGVDPAFLSQRATALENGRYVLAVVGEAKAGKSTLINALLGERILPTDVLQSSSAVVEIFKSEERFLEVRYANGRSEEIRDDLSTPDTDEAVDYLRKVGALQDRFRNIPTALIDSLIVQGRIEPGAALPIPELEKHSGLPLKDREKLVAEYVKGRTLANIPVQIRFGFPLTYAFDDLRLVDSPGVNAVGGVESRTYDYLHNVNAVLFVHSLEEPIETGSFRDFIMHVVPNRTREALFLVLSKSGLRSEIEVEEKLSEARSLFRQEFDSDRVIAVDSMLQIVSDEIHAFESALALKRHFGEQRKHYADLYRSEPQEWRDEAVNYDIRWRLLNETLDAIGEDADRDTVAKELRRRSNFDNLEDAIEEFSAQAPELQLSELLLAVRKGYDNQIEAHRQTIELLGKKKQHPQTFENEISSIQDRLAEYERELNDFSESLHRKHTGVNALSRDEVQQIGAQYVERLDDNESDSHVDKMAGDFNDDSAALVDRIADGIRTECQSKLESLGSAAKATYNITLPQVDVASITAQAKRQAYKTVKVKVDDSTGRRAATGSASGAAAGAGIGFVVGGPLGALVGAGIGALGGAATGSALGKKSYKDTKQFDSAKYRQNKRGLIRAAVQEVCNETVPAIVSLLIVNLVETFKREVGKLIKARRAALEEMKTRKRTNEEIVADMSSEERKKKRIDREMGRIAEMLEDLR